MATKKEEIVKEPEEKGYNVVFRYTERAGGLCGNAKWVSYESKENFERRFDPKKEDNVEVVVAGVSGDEAIQICAETPPLARICGALEKTIRIIKDLQNLQIDDPNEIVRIVKMTLEHEMMKSLFVV